ncbi:MAG: hypothetical protein Q7T55_08745 [Solirubrobacteraceae bacterium]|nr:hypothetical protein [Solirubrobacteraceae bacterium]
MRIVDFSPLPDRWEGREHLDTALGKVDLGDGRRTDPIDTAAAFGLGLPAELDDAAVRERAAHVRAELDGLMPEGYTVRFELADAERENASGAPTHVR